MKKGNYFFTSESVSEGHPDKVCDQVSDAILDAYLAQDPASRVACECLATTDRMTIAGEITSKGKVDADKVARNVIKDRLCGFGIGFDYKTCKIDVALHTQSPDIAMGVDTGGAGAGMMFGYATDETPNSCRSIMLAKACPLSPAVRKSSKIKYLRRIRRAVTVEYKNEKPVRVEAVVLSSQHDGNVTLSTIRRI